MSESRSAAGPDPAAVYPRPGDRNTCFLRNVVRSPGIEVGEFTIHHDFDDPTAFERRNVLYRYPMNGERLVIGRYCSVACGARFVFSGANHTLGSLSTYPFPLFPEWGEGFTVRDTWDVHGDIVVGNDVWIGYEAIVRAGVTIGDGAIVATRAVVTRDVPPYTIVGGVPARPIRRRFDDATVEALLALRWWDWPPAEVARCLPAIRAGDVAALQAGKPST